LGKCGYNKKKGKMENARKAPQREYKAPGEKPGKKEKSPQKRGLRKKKLRPT